MTFVIGVQMARRFTSSPDFHAMGIGRWFFLFGCWNVAAATVFVSVHEFMEHPMVDLPLFLLVMGTLSYLFLHRELWKNQPTEVGLLPLWVRGFHVIFWCEALMEAVVFTLLDFHDTPANDQFFIGFWLVLLGWLFGGWPWLARKVDRAD